MEQPDLADRLREMGADDIALELRRSASAVARWIRAVERGEALTDRQIAELVKGTRSLRYPLMRSDFKAHTRAGVN